MNIKMALLSITVFSSGLSWSQSCALPIEKINVASIGLHSSFDTLKQNFPTAFKKDMHDGSSAIAFKNAQGYSDNTLPSLEKQGVLSVMHLSMSNKNNRVVSYALNFSEGSMANLETPLDTFKQRLLSKFSLPQTGWKKQGSNYNYRCDDYRIQISQDHGVGRSSMGPTLMMAAKDSPMFRSSWE